MTYATGDSLQARIRIAFGASIAADPATWVWTDVTAWWHVPDDVTISWGRSSGADQAETSTFSATLKNTDGRFTAYDPRSPYWPNVRKWTPIEYDIDLGDGVGWRNRFSGYLRRLPLTWPGASPLMALAKIEAVGVLGRIGRGKPPARSPLRRTIGGSKPVAYWPGEDGVLSSQAGSATSGGAPLTVTGTVEFKPVDDYVSFAGSTTRYGTTALANLAAGGSLAAVPPPAATAATAARWTVHALVLADPTTLSGDMVVCEWTTAGGTYTRWQMKVTTTSRTQVIGFDAAGTSTVLIDDASATPAFAHFAVSASVSGGTVTVLLHRRETTTPSTTFAGTLGGVTWVTINPGGVTSTIDMPAGHVAVWATATLPLARTTFFDSYGGIVREARRSWEGEAATDRLARLTAEDGLTLDMPAVTADAVTRLGRQAPGTPSELYEQCEAADLGLIYESGFGLGYLPRGSRYNAPVTLTIDAAAGQLGLPFEPVDDDQALRNLWTVQRTDGSTAVAADEESIDLQGEIEGSATLALASDDPLPDHAGFRLHLSTVQEPRYPAVSLNLAANPELAGAWCDCKPGSRMQVVNPPQQNVPGVIDQLVVGATETYRGRQSWKATLNVVPASPWQVAQVDGEQRVGAEGSTLAAAISGAAMTPSVDSFSRHTATGWGAGWTTTGGSSTDYSVQGS